MTKKFKVTIYMPSSTITWEDCTEVVQKRDESMHVEFNNSLGQYLSSVGLPSLVQETK